MAPRPLTGHAVDVAPRLLGGILTSRIGGETVALRITEVEAYGGQGEDPGSHAFRRLTPRNATMFGPPGRAYVYFTYGMHWCLCVVTQPPGTAGAVLLRAGEVVDGVDAALARRGVDTRPRDLARGPARLTVALGVTGAVDGADLFSGDSPVQLALPRRVASDVRIGPRTGVGGEGALTPWRFHLAGEPTVSPYRPAARRSGPAVSRPAN